MTDDAGREFHPSAAPHIAIAKPDGTAIVAATDMTMVPVYYEGRLDYDAQSAEFGIGEKLTGGTSAATAYILGDRAGTAAAAGTLHLGNISGAFANNESITCTGGGAATADGDYYQCTYYYDVDASSTSNYALGTAYIATITYSDGTSSFTRYLYFDVAFYPMSFALVTTEDVENDHPSWTAARPQAWLDWTPAIGRAHGDLVRRIYAAGEQASAFVRREDELFRIQMAMVEAIIAREIGLTAEEIKYWEQKASEAWTSRGNFTVDDDDDSDIDSTDPKVISSGFTR
jgi:hypothetical protein